MDHFLSLPKAAKHLGYSVNSLKRFAAQGLLTIYRATPTSHPRVRLSEIEVLLQSQSRALPPGTGADFASIWDAVNKRWDEQHPKQRRNMH